MAHLSLSLLGRLQITLDDRPVTQIKYHKAKALLAYLAVEADRPQSRRELASLFWPDLPDETALKNLSQALTNLRQALGEAGPQGSFLLSTPDTLQLNPASGHTLDVAAFNELLATCEAHQHFKPETCTHCARRLEKAMGLYQDDFLAHFSLEGSAPFEEWAEAKRESLRQGALWALAQLTEYHVRHRNDEQAEALARRQLALDPWRESAHRQVMRVLALTGQRTAALAHYDHFRRELAQELEALPEWETTAIYEQLRGDTSAGPTARAAPARKVKLPTRLEPFIGRDKELAEITRLLGQPAHRLITLVGPGGIGKTRLAVEAARRQAPEFAEGAYFVPLVAVAAAEAIITGLTDALEIDIPNPVDPKLQLLSAVRDRELLLILDSVEHLLADERTEQALVELIRDILDQAPGVQLLVTSRERLRLASETVFQVPELKTPPPGATEQLEDYDAVKLFVACARRANPDFRLTAAEAGDVVGLCDVLGGMPLGIEMAAAWARALSCAEIAAELGRSLDFLQAPARDAPERHGSLRAAFDTGWRLLADEARRVFRRLAVFRGGFERVAAERVAGATAATLTTLVDKSWVQRSAAGRYDLHELVRQYGLAQLATSGDEDETRQRHSQYYCAFAESSAPLLGSKDKQRWMDRLELDLGNFRAALAWDMGDTGNAQEGLRLSNALLECWAMRGLLREGQAWLAGGLARETEVPEPIVARALMRAGNTALCTGEAAAGQQYMERALELGRKVGDNWCVAWALAKLGALAFFHLDGSAETMLTESLALFRRTDDRYGVATQLVYLGMLSRAHGEFERAQAYFTESLGLYQQLGDYFGTVDATSCLGKVARCRGDYARAAALYNQAIALAREKGFKFGTAETLMEQGLLAHLQGEDRQAEAYLAESIAIYSELDHYDLIGYCLAWLGAAATTERQPERAARLLGAALVQFDAGGRRLGLAEQTEYDRAVAAARAQLDEAAFTAAWAEGQALTREQAVALGLRSQAG